MVKDRNLNKESTISVFDWEGNSIENLIIPGHILSFAVDEGSKTIYGFDFSKQKLFKYKF